MGRAATVELWPSRNGRWYFHLRNVNGKITNPSQGYAHKRSATRRARQEHPTSTIETLKGRPHR